MSAAGSVTIDASRWPVVVHTAAGTLSDAQVDAYLREATAVVLRRERHVTVLDARRIGTVTAYTRSRALAWIRAHRARLATCCAGVVYVVDSPLLRFIVAATLLPSRLPMPYLVCDSLDDALAWARERLATPVAV